MPVMGGYLLVYRCYETITVYRMTRVFVGELWRRHARLLGSFGGKSERGGA
nr:MAG TPA: hypothetical protein [Siphoviridae sp. ctEci12]